MKSLSQIIKESETSVMINPDKKQFYFAVTPEKEAGWKFIKYSAPLDKIKHLLTSQGYEELNETSLSLKRLVKEAEDWPYYDFKNGYLYSKDDPKNPAFKVKFNSSIEAEKWLEDNNERGTVREDAQSDVDSGSGLDMDPNKSELNDSKIASTEYIFTAPDNSKIKIEVEPKDYHIMSISSDRGQATEARFELKAGHANGISQFRQLLQKLVAKGFKISKKASAHVEFDPPDDEDKYRYH